MASPSSDIQDAAQNLAKEADADMLESAVDEASKRLNYKLLKESFVSNLTGSSIGDINIVTMVSPLAGSLWAVLQSRQGFFEPYGLIPALADYMINIGTLLLSVTLYADQAILLNLAVLIPTIIFLLLPSSAASRKKNSPSAATLKKAGLKPNVSHTANKDYHALGIKPFITMYRGSMMAMTVIAILAVDFRVFPRRFAKVETWGTSLMDLGVGSFVFSAGVVGARPILKEKISGVKIGVITRMLTSLRHSIPLLILGLVRMISVKGLEYAEHTAEYGVHWNFFFTLGLLPPFVALSTVLYKFIPSFAAQAMIISTAYQVMLYATPLQNYIIMAERVDLLSKNREGIFSFVGYLAIFLAGQDMGMWVLPRHIKPQAPLSAASQRSALLKTMFMWSAIWSVLLVATTHYHGLGLAVSRRIANLPYVLWTAAFNTAQVMACCVVETVFFPAAHNPSASELRTEKEIHDAATSRLFRAINRNGLAIFLVANLLTGLVNMTVPTLTTSAGLSMAILIGYTGAVSAVALALDHFNITIRL
ncbi:Glucosaminyl phosphatidylinositol (GlcN-PI) nositol acylation protein [Ceratocystis pirilliformis]|uniref:GPI-anchored wall transfer protein n=1 Tax=Ceratocystis pirilliformis TaxID=259994 RepID=A0ABR3YP11_9PEZI